MRQILSQLNAAFSNLSLGKRITLGTLILGSIAGFVFLMNWTGKAEFQPLYGQLYAEDASAIISRLREQKIEYRIASNGSTILIPQELIYETRMQLASEGVPRGSGVGFEIFDNTILMLLNIMVLTRVFVILFVFEQMIKNTSNFMSSGRDSVRSAVFSSHPAEKGTQSAVTTTNALGSHSKGLSSPVL